MWVWPVGQGEALEGRRDTCLKFAHGHHRTTVRRRPAGQAASELSETSGSGRVVGGYARPDPAAFRARRMGGNDSQPEKPRQINAQMRWMQCEGLKVLLGGPEEFEAVVGAMIFEFGS